MPTIDELKAHPELLLTQEYTVTVCPYHIGDIMDEIGTGRDFEVVAYKTNDDGYVIEAWGTNQFPFTDPGAFECLLDYTH